MTSHFCPFGRHVGLHPLEIRVRGPSLDTPVNVCESVTVRRRVTEMSQSYTAPELGPGRYHPKHATASAPQSVARLIFCMYVVYAECGSARAQVSAIQRSRREGSECQHHHVRHHARWATCRPTFCFL